jgi:hypothetical protein
VVLTDDQWTVLEIVGDCWNLWIRIVGEFMADSSQPVSDQPVTEKPPVAMEYQGIGIRFVSLLIDSIILVIIIGVLGGVIGVGMMEMGTVPWWLGIIDFIIFIGYFTYLEGSRGQTIGKMITKITAC